MRLWLIGQKGVGKTSTGVALAEQLEWVKADTDHEIVAWRQLNIPTIIQQEGEAAFREYETETIRRLAEADTVRNVVISTGGGSCMSAKNRKMMSDSGTVVYLHTHRHRGWSEWKRHYQYHNLADHTIYTDGKTRKQVAAIIAAILGHGE